LERYKSPGSDQILAELIQAGSEILHSENHNLILFGIRKNCLTKGRSPYIDEIIGDIRVGFDLTDQLLIGSFVFVTYWRKNGSTMRQYISYS
jgi:hypothetical protein